MQPLHLSFASDAWTIARSPEGYRLCQGDLVLDAVPEEEGLRIHFQAQALTVVESGVAPQAFRTALLPDGRLPPGAPADPAEAALWVAERAIGRSAWLVCQALRRLAEAWADAAEGPVLLAVHGRRSGKRARARRRPDASGAPPQKALRLHVAADETTGRRLLLETPLPPSVSTAIRLVSVLPWETGDNLGPHPEQAIALVCASPEASAHARLSRRRAAAEALAATGLAWPDAVLP